MPTLPIFPTIDLTQFKLPQVKVPQFEIPKVGLTSVDTDKLAGILRDAAYVVIGFGVLTVQQIQVRRRELVASLSSNPVVTQLGATKAQIEEFVASLEARAGQFDERFDAIEARLDAVVAQLEQRLPEQASAVVGQAHDLAKAARKQVRGLIRSAA